MGNANHPPPRKTPALGGDGARADLEDLGYRDKPVVSSQEAVLENHVSLVQSATDTACTTVSITDIIRDIESQRHRGLVERIREAYATGGKDAANPLKKSLPGVCWSGTFTHRSNAALEKHSGLICADLDDLGDGLEDIREQVIRDPFTFAAFVSPTGSGLKIVFRCDPSRLHIESFHAAARYCLETFGVEIDGACKEVARLCFLSWDPDVYFNSEAPVIPYVTAPVEFSPRGITAATVIGTTPGDDYDTKADVPALLRRHGWTQAGRHGWTRPGKTSGVSATWDHVPGRFFCFTSSTQLEANHVYRPWHLYAILEHGGAFSAAAAQLRRDGFGAPAPRPENPASFPGEVLLDETEATAPSLDPVPLFDIVAPDETSQKAKNLLGNGFLRRGQAGLINGPTGIGKSVFTMQASGCWSCGRSVFGIRPEKPLRILIVQSENDDADMAEMRDGIVAALTFTAEEIALIKANVVTLRSFKSGRAFVDELDAIAGTFRPDLIICDPLFAYAGIDVSKDQPGLSKFLRGMIQPLLIKHDCGLVFVHHTNKPPSSAKDRSQWSGGDHAYSGSGHNELANFPRFVIVLRSMGSRTVFELRIGKRWKRAGIVDEQGRPLDHVLIQHGANSIHWKTATQTDLARSMEPTVTGAATGKTDDAQRIVDAFHAKQKDGRLDLEVLARKVKVSPKTIRRRFGDGGILRHGEDVLCLSNSVVSLTVDQTQDDLV